MGRKGNRMGKGEGGGQSETGGMWLTLPEIFAENFLKKEDIERESVRKRERVRMRDR